REGAAGVALSWVVAFPIVFYVGLRRTARSLSVPVSMMLRPMATPAVCAAASALTAQVVLWGASAGNLPPLAVVAVQGGAGGLCYLAMYKALDRPHYDQTLNMVRRLIRA